MPAPVRNAFSIDVEDYFQVSAFESVVERKDWNSLASRVEGNTERLLSLLADHDVNATFFVLGWIAERHPTLVRRISEAGHEVACHGFSHRRIYQQDKDEFSTETARSKQILEDCTGVAVVGYRAASFSITKDSLWALDVLVEAGFHYDSSIYPVWHDNYGIPDAALEPSRLATPTGGSIAEFPLSTYRVAKVPLPVGGGGYFRLYPYQLTRAMLHAIVREGRPINFYCHPWEIDVDQPRFTEAPWKSRFRHYNNIDKFEDRLKRLLSDFKFTTCGNVLRDYGLLDAAMPVGA